MRIYKSSASIRAAYADAMGTELSDLIGRRIQELQGYEEDDLSRLVKIIVIESGDAIFTIDAQLDFSLIERKCDVVENHQDWYELTLVLSDDGFGIVIFIPKSRDIDPQLQNYCSCQMEARSP